MIDTGEIVLRLGLATLAGLMLGFDRELRGFPAGLRTHGIVALSSAAITVTSMKLFYEMGGGPGGDSDPLRVIQGVAQAIGFIAAGIVFASRGEVHNVTTAANLWLAAALGIAAGAAHFEVVGVALGIGLILLVALPLAERLLRGRRSEGEQEPDR